MLDGFCEQADGFNTSRHSQRGRWERGKIFRWCVNDPRHRYIIKGCYIYMYLSYKKDYPNYIIIKITDKYIELNLDPTKPIKILLRDIVKIEFEQRKVSSIVSFQSPAFRYPLFIVIRTNILKFQINVDDLEDVEKLINYLNSTIPEKNIYLPNIRYLDYIHNDKVHLNIMKLMFVFLILFIFYVFTTND
jgi:hypothetical protein